ncbi:MAG TPA: FAD-dependent oxidoreductase [Prosthecobacter sp.]|nr:FAD-dependent oxidoreductase [Prosthecobacter sp.]
MKRSLLQLMMTCAVLAHAEEADVCVYGGTSGGVVAAVEAARLGNRVILIEPGRHLGGMSSSGLGWTDNGSTETIGGLSREFYRRVYQYYTKPEAWRYQTRESYLSWLPKIWGVDGPRMEEIKAQFIFEPHAAEAVFNEMTKEAGVKVVYEERLELKDGVHLDGKRIRKIVMESGKQYAANVFIDASYEGDVMARAGVKYIIGREPNSQYGETLNGAFPFTPAPFPKISPYVVAGDPSSGLLPRVEPRPPGPKGTGDHRVQAYNFRVCLTDIPENKVPIEKPAAYNPVDYELLMRHIGTMKNVRPGPRKHAAIGLRGNGGDLGINFELVPNRKTDSNNGSEFGSDMYGASYGWSESDYVGRQKIWEQHRDYLLGMLWFLGNDARLPVEVRTEMQRWGLPKDEFKDNGHFPHQLYVREARRMISDYVITENDARGTRTIEDPVALASYPLDSHGVTLYVDEKGVLHRERGFYQGIKPFPISYKALRPRAEECVNLLVPCCLSASHAAYGSVRMEPVFMMLGHASGIAADLAVKQGVSLQDVPYPALKERLLAEKQILEWNAPRSASVAARSESTMPPNEQLISDVKVLVAEKIVDSPDYWLANARSGRQCDGKEVQAMLLKMARAFEPAENLSGALSVLKTRKVLSSPAFWAERAVADRNCSGENVRLVIRNFARVAPKS